MKIQNYMMIHPNDIEYVMKHIRNRHVETTCDYDGRVISERDSVWANISADVVQEILVMFFKEKRKFEKEVNEKFPLKESKPWKTAKNHCIVCKKKLIRKHFGFIGAGAGTIHFGYGSKHDLMWADVAICEKCIKPIYVVLESVKKYCQIIVKE
jgi:hypothetical protein